MGCWDSVFQNDSYQTTQNQNLDGAQVNENGTYTSKEEVAAYIHKYNHLPSNFIIKEEAMVLGWTSSEGNLDRVAPGKSIGGDQRECIEKELKQK